MAPASAAVLLSAVAAALMAMAVLQLSAAAAAAPPPAPVPIGLPGCDTTCGNVSVPYPFGFGPSHCYWPGLNLTCDTSKHPPQLLLGDGSLWLRVTEISLRNQTVRVMRPGCIINTTGDLFTSDGWDASLDFGRGFRERGYLLSARNELYVSGCNVMATISASIVDYGKETTRIISGCTSFCTMTDDNGARSMHHNYDNYWRQDKFCTGTSACCLQLLSSSGMPVPNGVQARWLYSGNHAAEQTYVPVTVLVAEEGWVEKEQPFDGIEEAPLLLDFAVRQDLPQHQDDLTCTQDVQGRLCKSENSECFGRYPGTGYLCKCNDGYDGNAYIAGGCQDVDECKLLGEDRVCFGACINTIGSYDCQCPQGTHGQPEMEGGCVDYKFSKDAQVPTIGMPGCNTRCGNVDVPYPFGFGSSSCYWPGLNLTCDTSHDTPRLLLDGNSTGNGTIQVVHISLHNSTLQVIHHSSNNYVSYSIIDNETNSRPQLDVRLPDIVEPYVLSTTNEFIVISEWEGHATLHGEYENNSSSIISRAVCSSGHDGCCHAPILAGSTPKRMEFHGLNKNLSLFSNWWGLGALAFISVEGLTEEWHKIFNMNYTHEPHYMSSPIVLQWAVKHGFPAATANNSGKCSSLCKSKNSDCRQENGGFTCHCSQGYDGNPYVADGCQDIDECNNPAVRKSCLDLYGSCFNFPGGYECQCPPGMHGNLYQPGGCVVVNKSKTRLIIGFSAASGPVPVLVLGIWFLLRKYKQRKIKLMKQKYFKQNRGQLLQQLLSQKADIAERMIIPLEELAKATNNFDKAREIGGGGHGTVYKGILSDLHVVAIKKPKITVQKEIDEFINEVAILSQINHKNVVKLFGCCLETEVPLLVYEFIPNGTLYHHLHIEGQERSLPWSSRLRIATEIATSLAYLHSSVSIPIIHRDIKSSNILLDDRMTSKISDFGASRYIPTDNTGLTTRIQGTFGYLDPECFNTGRLTEKSDVYSFGVILVELLTRKKPTCSHLSSEYGGLVPHFLNLLASKNLVQIMDPQVLEEGGTEVQQVVMLATSCINIRGEERPTMRQVEHTLEGLQQGSNKKYKKDDMVSEDFDIGSIGENYPSWISERQRFEESTRRYSLEQEMMMSARYPR